MGRELLLMRHGKSDWKRDCDDFHRPLKDRGKRAAQRVGVWLAQQELKPDFVIASPAERAITSAEKCVKAMGMAAHGIVSHPGIYLATTGELLRILADTPRDAGRVMLVGHNPGLEDLVDYLSDERPEIPLDGKLIPTATLAHFAMPDDWSALKGGCARLIEIRRPVSLPERFPYPMPFGAEQRDRPDYYYTQSGVIPYRLVEGRMEVLLVRSSKGKHWVVPKGVADPGSSYQESAAKEAREEAGVLGEVEDELLGAYTMTKWGADCSVNMYAMRVTEVQPEAVWEESHRGRCWVSPAEAGRMLREPALAPMIDRLSERLCRD